MSKAIYFAGVSRVAGELKFRTATEPSRFQQLIKLGDTDVEMVNLRAETKQQAAQELLNRNFANGRADIQALLESVAGKVSAPRKAREVRVKSKQVKLDKEPKLSIEEANARVMATMREITPERALELLCNRMPKKRRSRKTQPEAV
jgi:predicted Abi (CAAX) family protease